MHSNFEIELKPKFDKTKITKTSKTEKHNRSTDEIYDYQHSYLRKNDIKCAEKKDILNNISYIFSSYNILFTLVILISTKQAQSFCPSRCVCNARNLNYVTSCINAELEVVPIQLNPDTKFINLTLNEIQNVDFALPFYTKLEVLDLSRNMMETLGTKNFEFQKELITLNISHNRVTSLGKETFKGLKNLLVLDLSYNGIEIIHSDAMEDLISIIELNLSNNFIVSMEAAIYKNMISLEILSLRNNQLLDVPTNNIKYLENLKTLDLSRNLIEFVRNEELDQLKQIVVLNISGNVISKIESNAFNGLINLEQMDVSDNNLTIVPTSQLSNLSNLTYLSLNGNRFTEIPGLAFLNLFQLKELHLSRLDKLLKIDPRAFVDNTSLQKINLNGNQLFTELPLRLFHGNLNLIEISIQSNNLQTLEAAQFPIDRIQQLYLGHNPFQCNCSIKWLWQLITGKIEEKYIVTSTEINLILDHKLIGCNEEKGNQIIHRLVNELSETEISCPPHILSVVCAILTIIIVIMTGISVIFYFRHVRRGRQKLLQSGRVTKTVVNNERMLQPTQNTQNQFQQQSQVTPVHKLNLEKYVDAEAIANEYQAIKPWDSPVKKPLTENTEHLYERFDHYEYPDASTMAKAHVVYV